MTTAQNESQALGDVAARQLANATKTVPQMSSITRGGCCICCSWVPVEAGIYRVNRVKDPIEVEVDCSGRDERVLPADLRRLRENPREYMLTAVTTVLDVHTRVSDLYSSPYNQISEQLRLIIETIKERQESELINNKEYGLLHNVAPKQKVKTRTGAPTPDDLDELLSKVWKEPGFFLTHPAGIAAFGREATRRGVPPPTVTLFGSQFLTWRGIPLVPVGQGALRRTRRRSSSSCARARAGRASWASSSRTCRASRASGLSVRFMGINPKAIASYLISLYCSLAVLTDDALAVLDGRGGRQVP